MSSTSLDFAKAATRSSFFPECTGSGRKNNPRDNIDERASDRPASGRLGLRSLSRQAERKVAAQPRTNGNRVAEKNVSTQMHMVMPVDV